jgi:hypothetical protein
MAMRKMLLGTEELNRAHFSNDFLIRSASQLPSEIPAVEFFSLSAKRYM